MTSVKNISYLILGVIKEFFNFGPKIECPSLFKIFFTFWNVLQLLVQMFGLADLLSLWNMCLSIKNNVNCQIISTLNSVVKHLKNLQLIPVWIIFHYMIFVFAMILVSFGMNPGSNPTLLFSVGLELYCTNKLWPARSFLSFYLSPFTCEIERKANNCYIVLYKN